MTVYRFKDDPDERLYLHINREFNENIPPHQRYEWSRKVNDESVPLSIEHIDDTNDVFVFKNGDVVDLGKKTFNGRAIFAEKHRF